MLRTPSQPVSHQVPADFVSFCNDVPQANFHPHLVTNVSLVNPEDPHHLLEFQWKRLLFVAGTALLTISLVVLEEIVKTLRTLTPLVKFRCNPTQGASTHCASCVIEEPVQTTASSRRNSSSTELTLISLVALTSLGDRVGVGVGDAVGGVRLLRLPLSLVSLVELVALALVSLVPLVSLSARSSMKIFVSCGTSRGATTLFFRGLCQFLVLCFLLLPAFLLQR